MNHTPNYNLSQWSKDDRIRMDDFNADNAKIDAALGEKLRLVTGRYQGTGKYGPDNPNILEVPDAERPPRAVLLSEDNGRHQLILLRGMPQCYTYTPLDKACYIELTWTDKGVRWYGTHSSVTQFNSVATYHYAVFI